MKTSKVSLNDNVLSKHKVSQVGITNILLFFLGAVLFFVGVFMVTGINTWEIFSVWLPLALVVSGVVLLGSNTNPTWYGLILVILSALVWFHSYGLANFPTLTHIIDWFFLLLGCVVLYIAIMRIEKNTGVK